MKGRTVNSESKQETINHLEAIINERINDVIGTYCDDKWKPLTTRLVNEDATTLANEIAIAVSSGVAVALSNDEEWPTTCTAPTRPVEIVLSAKQVASVINCFWYINAAQFTQLECERNWFPGWKYVWVLNRVRATGACIHDKDKFNGMRVADALDSVLIRRDGSGVTTFTDGRMVSTPAQPVDEQCPMPVTRIDEPKEMYGYYMTVKELEKRIAEKAALEDTAEYDDEDDFDINSEDVEEDDFDA